MVHGRTWRARNSARAREPGGGGAMGRRSTVDRSPQSDVYSADYVAGTGDLAQGGGRKERTPSGWRGAGGRWLVWVFRVAVWPAQQRSPLVRTGRARDGPGPLKRRRLACGAGEPSAESHPITPLK